MTLFLSLAHTQTHTVDNRVRQREYGTFQLTEGSIFSNCVCHTANMIDPHTQTDVMSRVIKSWFV